MTTLPTTGEQTEFLATLPDAVQHNVCRFYFQLISEESGEASSELDVLSQGLCDRLPVRRNPRQ